jgi:two-component system, NarL family, response regulator LiaR
MSKSTGQIRVLIVDDQEIIRHGLALMVNSQADMTAIGTAPDGQTGARLARELDADVVLMDIMMPGLNGIQATRQISAENRGARVIILTTYDADNLVFEGVRAGAIGYLLKGARSESVLAAIRGAYRGESQLDTGIAAKVLDEFRRMSQLVPMQAEAQVKSNDDAPAVERLTEREMDVLRLIAEGLSNKDIAERLVLSEGTVKNHVSAIMAKLHANDRAQVIVKAARKRLVRLD